MENDFSKHSCEIVFLFLTPYIKSYREKGKRKWKGEDGWKEIKGGVRSKKENMTLFPYKKENIFHS